MTKELEFSECQPYYDKEQYWKQATNSQLTQDKIHMLRQPQDSVVHVVGICKERLSCELQLRK